MNITDFFDMSKFEHLQAYRHLCNTGAWPMGFVPAGITFEPCWQVALANSMANEYISIVLDGKVVHHQ